MPRCGVGSWVVLVMILFHKHTICVFVNDLWLVLHYSPTFVSGCQQCLSVVHSPPLQLPSNRLYPSTQALATEIVALEERHRATRAAELRLGKEAAGLRDALEDARRQLQRAQGSEVRGHGCVCGMYLMTSTMRVQQVGGAYRDGFDGWVIRHVSI